MTDAAVTLPFVFALHGYATARKNNEMKWGCSILSLVPVCLDIIVGQTAQYAKALALPASSFIIGIFLAFIILGMSWGVGYFIGYINKNKEV